MYADTDIYYLAGLYEGEGTCNIHRNRDRYYARLLIRMTDKEPLEKLYGIFGGIYAGPYSSPCEIAKGYKPKYRWAVGKTDQFKELANLILPLLSPRRQGQVQKALDLINSYEAIPVVAGARRNGLPIPQRPKKFGELVCPDKPEPSARGYQRHRALGIPVCDTCRESSKLYYSARREWYKDRIHEINREQYQKNREARCESARAYRRKTKAPDEPDPQTTLISD